ncbi:hypothetical protein HJ526_07685 [Donghicola sp. C2-DW-16]|uniref:Uncharacterized protein n=1 Tax=Donghicola mangrovi TaxID=2729614 RepID=A0ABX2PCU3_9RHOB|nr:hypothetical protein [Donghicola mangrovi]NVO27294.1 hypothetical protein [Donghicola mangrovi]
MVRLIMGIGAGAITASVAFMILALMVGPPGVPNTRPSDFDEEEREILATIYPDWLISKRFLSPEEERYGMMLIEVLCEEPSNEMQMSLPEKSKAGSFGAVENSGLPPADLATLHISFLGGSEALADLEYLSTFRADVTARIDPALPTRDLLEAAYQRFGFKTSALALLEDHIVVSLMPDVTFYKRFETALASGKDIVVDLGTLNFDKLTLLSFLGKS